MNLLRSEIPHIVKVISFPVKIFVVNFRRKRLSNSETVFAHLNGVFKQVCPVQSSKALPCHVEALYVPRYGYTQLLRRSICKERIVARNTRKIRQRNTGTF